MNNENKNAFFNLFLKNLQFFILNFIDKSKALVLTHQKKIRPNFQLKRFPNQIFLTGLPIILGFYQFIYNKYGTKNKYIFFERNLPIFSLPIEIINWETFKYFNFPKNFTLTSNKFQTGGVKSKKPTFDWNEQALLIFSINKQKSNNELGTYIFHKQVSSGEEISLLVSDQPGEQSSLFVKSKPDNSFISSYYYFTLVENTPVSNFLKANNDDIPLKLSSSWIQTNNFVFKKLVSYEKTIPSRRTSRHTLLSSLKQYNTLFSKLRGFKSRFTKPLHNLTGQNQEKTQSFFDISDLLNKEFLNIFINLQLLPSSEQNTQVFQIEYLKNFELESLIELIQYLDNFLISSNQNLTRDMSGYRYPDMDFVDIQFLQNQLKFKPFTTLKINLPPNYLISQKSNFKVLQAIQEQKLSPFLIKGKKFSLKNSEDNSLIYNGPGFLFNRLTGFDWEILSKEPNSYYSNFREFLENKLGVKNPLTDKYSNFSGLLESPKIPDITKQQILNGIDQNRSIKKFDSQDIDLLLYWIRNLPIFRIENTVNPVESFLNFQREFYLPFLITSNLDKAEQPSLIENQISQENTKPSYGFSNLFLPVLETRIPDQNKSKSLFGFKTGLDFIFTYPVDENNAIESKFVPNTLTALNDQGFQNYLASGIYKQEPSLISKNKIPFFFDSWEPLSARSWLITTQLGFAVIVFQVLKALIDNYGRELLVYLLDLVAILGFVDENIKQEIEILMGQREKGFRIISKISKNFNNIAGIKLLLPEIIEIVWFLRNSGRDFSFSNTIPRGLLLTGPPGTGKTLLVQAIAGEANVPVVALSGSSLLEPGESGALKLELVFEEARKLAPCIVFIDEIDSVAQKREEVVSNPMDEEELLESLESIYSINLLPAKNLEKQHTLTTQASVFKHQTIEKEKLRILSQFLIELDGIKTREGVIVIGATNYPESLDLAVLRPGRLDRIVEVGLPTPDKRESIFQLYSRPLGTSNTIPWNYLVRRTVGYTAADLASLMNQSALYAILQGTKHTLETIEYGIDRLTTIGFATPIKKDKFVLDVFQLAYYQAGKILLGLLLEYNPSVLVTSLWPKKHNNRAIRIQQNLQNYFFKVARQIQLEHRVIGCYGGKAAEILFLQKYRKKENLSDFGLDDIHFGQSLIKLMVENWYFFSKTSITQEITEIFSDYNKKEYRAMPEKIGYYSPYIDELDTDEIVNPKVPPEENLTNYSENFQNYSFTAVLQDNVSEEFELSSRLFSNWYRLYLPDSDKNERNIEWMPPEEFYHGNTLPKLLTQSIYWNDLAQISNEYQTHSLILQSFNKAFILINLNRELLDQLSYELMSKELLREDDISKISKNFSIKFLSSNLLTNDFLNLKNPLIIQRNWGQNSRRKKIHWLIPDLNFNFISFAIFHFVISELIFFQFVLCEYEIFQLIYYIVYFSDFVALEFDPVTKTLKILK